MSLPKINTPIYELKLPSSGNTIRYRPFLVKEHKILLTLQNADNSEVSKIVEELVRVCTFDKLNISMLPHFDIEYIFLHLRAKSIGETVDVVVNCECGNKIDASFNIEDVRVEKPLEHSNKIKLNEEYGVEMSYPKFNEVVKVFESNDTEEVINLILKNIVGVFDNENYWNIKEQTKEEVEEFVNSLTKDQFDKIENFFVTSPKIVQQIETDCPKCGRHNISRLEGLGNFFV